MAQAGKVKWFNDAKGYGFLRTDGIEGDIFVHHTAIQCEGFRTLTQNEDVVFDLVEGPKGPKAENVVRSGVPEGASEPAEADAVALDTASN